MIKTPSSRDDPWRNDYIVGIESRISTIHNQIEAVFVLTS